MGGCEIFSCFDSWRLKLFWNSRITLLKKPHEITHKTILKDEICTHGFKTLKTQCDNQYFNAWVTTF